MFIQSLTVTDRHLILKAINTSPLFSGNRGLLFQGLFFNEFVFCFITTPRLYVITL